MKVPGSNLLKLANKVIAQQKFYYLANTGRTTNSIGLDVASYAAPQMMRGNVQPIPRSMYERLGLDFQKNYFTVYVARDVLDVDRDVSGDQISWAGRRLQCESKTDWFPIDGWDAILTVVVPMPRAARFRITPGGDRRITATSKHREVPPALP